MLADKDRIFTNIYGRFDRSLAGAIRRGHWVCAFSRSSNPIW